MSDAIGGVVNMMLVIFFIVFIALYMSFSINYQKAFNTTFIRIIRSIAFIIAIFLPGTFISVTTRNYNLIPLYYKSSLL